MLVIVRMRSPPRDRVDCDYCYRPANLHPPPPNIRPNQVRPLDEWISLSEDGGDGTRFLPALFLSREREGRRGAWVECQVQSYDHDTRRFEVLYFKSPGDVDMSSAEVRAAAGMHC